MKKRRCALGKAAFVAAISLQGTGQGMAQERGIAEPPAVQHELVTEYETNPIEYRALLKQALEGHLGALGLLATRRAPGPDQQPFHADALVQLTANHTSLYPAGSETARTRESIWADPVSFDSASKETAEIAVRLRDAVDRGDLHQVMNGLVALGESCEACHARFRVAGDR